MKEKITRFLAMVSVFILGFKYGYKFGKSFQKTKDNTKRRLHR